MVELLFGLAISVLLMILGILAILATRNHRADIRFQVGLFLGAYAIRFALSVVIYQGGLVNVLGDDDSSGWIGGLIKRDAWVEGGMGLLDLPAVLLGAFQGLNRGYSYWLGLFFYITNTPVRLVAATPSCLCGALTVVFSYRMARLLFSRAVAVRVGWWTCFFPSLILWSAQTVKEPIVILLEVLSVYGCLQLRNNRFSIRHIILCSISIVLLVTLRFYAAYITAAVVVVSLVMPQVGQRRLPIASALGVLALVLPLLLFSGAIEQHEAVIESFDLQRAETFRRDLAKTANTSIEHNYDIKTPTGFLMGVTIGAAHLLLAPFPWQLGGSSLRMALTLPELIVWWVLFFTGVLPGLKEAVRERLGDVLPLLLFLLGLGLVYSVTTGNIGLMYRQRVQLMPYLLIFAASHFERRALLRSAGRRATVPDSPEWPTNPIAASGAP